MVKITNRKMSAKKIVQRAMNQELERIQDLIEWTINARDAAEIDAEGPETGTARHFRRLNRYKTNLRRLYAERRRARIAMETVGAALK